MSKRERSLHILEAIRRAFAEFLTIPTIVIGAFLLLAAATYFLDAMRIARGWPAPIPGTHDSATHLLGTIATSIITVTSITFSLLLVAVQQGAAALTSQVYDQFLRRWSNQFYFGFFIGLALYCLVILATIHPSYTPIYGLTLALILTIAALYLLILLIYTTIDQMRPVVIVQAIRDHTLRARECQRGLLRRTRRTAHATNGPAIQVAADKAGFLTRVNVAAIDKAAGKCAAGTEIVMRRSIGDYVAFRDIIAEIRTPDGTDVAAMRKALVAALVIETQRDLDTDPAFGIEQLVTIGWTSISTAKSNPEPGQFACWSLRDILAHWSEDEHVERNEEMAPEAASPVVYTDNAPDVLLDAFESLTVVASESMQHQTLAEIYRSFAASFPRLSSPLQDRAEDILLRSVSALGEHVPTRYLGDAIADLIETLERSGRATTAETMRTAWRSLETNVGLLNSRATRVPARA